VLGAYQRERCSWGNPQSAGGWWISLCFHQSVVSAIQVMGAATAMLMWPGFVFLIGEGPPLGAGTESLQGGSHAAIAC